MPRTPAEPCNHPLTTKIPAQPPLLHQETLAKLPDLQSLFIPNLVKLSAAIHELRETFGRYVALTTAPDSKNSMEPQETRPMWFTRCMETQGVNALDAIRAVELDLRSMMGKARSGKPPTPVQPVHFEEGEIDLSTSHLPKEPGGEVAKENNSPSSLSSTAQVVQDPLCDEPSRTQHILKEIALVSFLLSEVRKDVPEVREFYLNDIKSFRPPSGSEIPEWYHTIATKGFARVDRSTKLELTLNIFENTLIRLERALLSPATMHDAFSQRARSNVPSPGLAKHPRHYVAQKHPSSGPQEQ